MNSEKSPLYPPNKRRKLNCPIPTESDKSKKYVTPLGIFTLGELEQLPDETIKWMLAILQLIELQN